MSRFLGSMCDANIKHAIVCYKFYRKYQRPFAHYDVGIEGHALKNLAERGIIKRVIKGKYRESNKYLMPDNIKSLLERRFSDRL